SKNNESLVYEHMVPKNLYLTKIVSQAFEGTLTEQIIYELLDKYFYICTVSGVENNKLPKTNMGTGWNNKDPFYRYKTSGIRFYPNRFNQLYFNN
ncbi:MAG TPA: hypothetical protein VNR61_18700, partial [Niallia sp.]|nr:hypothetical protein [Niallia sp.]